MPHPEMVAFVHIYRRITSQDESMFLVWRKIAETLLMPNYFSPVPSNSFFSTATNMDVRVLSRADGFHLTIYTNRCCSKFEEK